MIDIYCQIVYVIYIYIFEYSIFYHMVVHLLRMVAKSCTSWWFILWFIGFQPSVWWRGISQPSTVGARNSQIEGQLLQVLVMVQPKKRVFMMRQTGFNWFTRLQPATDWQASADSCAEILQWLAGNGGLRDIKSINTGWWFGTFFPYIGNVIIPTDEHIFFRGFKPPTRIGGLRCVLHCNVGGKLR